MRNESGINHHETPSNNFGCLVALALTALSTNWSRAGDSEWVSLFDGTTLSGWTKGGSQDSKRQQGLRTTFPWVFWGFHGKYKIFI